MHFIRAYQLSGLHTAHEGHRNVHLSQAHHQHRTERPAGGGTYEDDIKRTITLHARLERVDGQRAILRNLDCMSVLLQYLHCEFLVHQIIFREQNVEYHVVRRCRRADGARLECRDERRREVLCAHGRCHFRTDAIIQAPFHCCVGSALRMIRFWRRGNVRFNRGSFWKGLEV